MRRACARGLFLNTRLVEYRRVEASAGDGDCAFREQSAGRRSQDPQRTVMPHALRTRAADKCADDEACEKAGQEASYENVGENTVQTSHRQHGSPRPRANSCISGNATASFTRNATSPFALARDTAAEGSVKLAI